MKIFKIFPAFLALLLLFSLAAPAALAQEAPRLTAQAVLLADLDSGVILYEFNGDVQRSPASLTKIMTILLTLEAVERGEVSLDDPVTAGADCRSGMRDDSSSVGIVPGETMSLRDLVYCAAVASGNDACNVIAVHVAGSIPAFVERMNARAAELGCGQTRFVDPHGLSYDDLTSARDLYRICLEALKHPAFLEICDSSSYIVPATDKRDSRQLKSSNALISGEGIYGAGYLYEGAHGIKTGYTRAAGYCLISTAQRGGMRLLAIVLGCDGPYLSNTETRYSFVDTARLYDWAFASFSPRCVLPEGQVLETAPVLLAGEGARVGLIPRQGLTLPLPAEADDSRLELRVSLRSPVLCAPLEAGETLGEVRVYLDGRELTRAELTAAAGVPSVCAVILRYFILFSNRTA